MLVLQNTVEFNSEPFLSLFSVCVPLELFGSPPPYLTWLPTLVAPMVTWLSEHIPPSLPLSLSVWGKGAGRAACLPACLWTRWPWACLWCGVFTLEYLWECGYCWPWDAVNTVARSISLLPTMITKCNTWFNAPKMLCVRERDSTRLYYNKRTHAH